MSQSHSWDPCTSWVLVLLGLAEGNRGGKGPRLSSKVESEKGSHICKLKESREKHSALRKTVEKKDMEGKGQKKISQVERTSHRRGSHHPLASRSQQGKQRSALPLQQPLEPPGGLGPDVSAVTAEGRKQRASTKLSVRCQLCSHRPRDTNHLLKSYTKDFSSILSG